MIRTVQSDFNPPLWQILSYPVIKLLGENEFALRLPSLIASLMTIYIAWKIVKKLAPGNQRWNLFAFAALLIGLLPAHFWTAQEGRIYSIMGLLYLLGIYFCLTKKWLGFGACVGLLLYSQGIAVFYVASLIAGAVILQRDQQKRVVLYSTLGILTFIPWVPSLLSTTSTFFMSEFRWNDIIRAISEAFFVGTLENTPLYFGIIVLGISFFTALRRNASDLFRPGLPVQPLLSSELSDHQTNYLHLKKGLLLAWVIWAVFPLFFIILAAPFKNVLYYRAVSVMVVPLCIWLAVSLSPKKITPWNYLIPLGWIIVILLGVINWTPMAKGSSLREAAQFINQSWQEGDIIYHATGTSYLPLSFYVNHRAFLLDEVLPDGLLQQHLQNEYHISRMRLETIPHKRAWIVWARDPLITNQANQRMIDYTKGASIVWTIHYWQAADIEIYLIPAR